VFPTANLESEYSLHTSLSSLVLIHSCLTPLLPISADISHELSKYSFDAVTEPYVLSCDVPQSTAGTKAFVWSCYLIHQVVIWAMIFKAQRIHRDDTQYHSQLNWYNRVSFLVNAFFYVLHLIQTHTTYDAIAQDVTEASSQGSVILLLVIVNLMEYKSRGLFLGWPAHTDQANICCRRCNNSRCSWRLPASPVELVRKYHGYAFSWAAIYTLWYHPMESTAAHVTGFMHVGLLLIQQSLMFTPMHLNKYWRMTLEVWVAIHGAITAAQMQHMSGMFLFGFLWMAVFTQIHGLPYYLAFVEKSNEIGTDVGNNAEEAEETTERDKPSYLDTFYQFVPSSRWKRWCLRLVPPILYFMVVIVSYQTWLSVADQSLGVQMSAIIRIPLILYLMVLFVAIVGWGMLVASNQSCICCTRKENVTEDEEDEQESGVIETSANVETISRKGVGTGPGKVLAALFFAYGSMVSISVVFQVFHVQMTLILQMIVLVAIFAVNALFAMIVMEKDMRRVELGPPQLPKAAETEQETLDTVKETIERT
jgi:flagellar basal body-associated protein FliL